MQDQRGDGAGAVTTPRLSVVVPTLNEAGNVGVLVSRLDEALGAALAEIIFVDDSTDETPDVIEAVAEAARPAVRLIHRPVADRGDGLGGAVLRGLHAARQDWVCVMDSDLQHPPELVPELFRVATESDTDVVIASRRVPGGVDEGLTRARRLGSDGATAIAKTLFPSRLSNVTDPLSGFFLVNRTAIPMDHLRPDGFKILLEILVRSPGLSVAEIPFRFGERHSGETKASAREAARYLRLLGTLRATPNARPRRRPGGYYYSIHGIIGVRSDVALPELVKFRTEPGERDRSDIVVTLGNPARASGDRSVLYREFLGKYGFAVSISKGDVTSIVVSQLVARSPHVLYTNVVEPVLRWGLVERGFALVHAACVEIDGRGYFVTAKTDTGKTTTTLRLLEDSDYGFISDDLSLIDARGVVRTYPKPMTISSHTIDALQSANLSRKQSATLPFQSRLHSRSGRRVGLSLAKTRLPAATMNAVVQKLVPPPKYHVEQLVRGSVVAPTAQVAALFVITRGEDEKRMLTDSEAIELLIENSADAYGFPPYFQIEPFLRTHRGDDLAEAERQIIAAAFAHCPAWLIGSRTMDWADHIQSYIENGHSSAAAMPDPKETPDDEDGVVIDLTIDTRPSIGLGDVDQRTAGREQ